MPGGPGGRLTGSLGCLVAALGAMGCAPMPGDVGTGTRHAIDPAPVQAAEPFDRAGSRPEGGAAIEDANAVKEPPMPEDSPVPEPGTSDLLVSLAPGTAARDLAAQYGLTWVRTLQSDADMHVLSAPSEEEARRALSRLQGDPAVRSAYLDIRVPHVPRRTRPDSTP